MALPKEIIDAKNLIFEYQEKLIKSLVPHQYVCICCKTEVIKRLGDEIFIREPLEQQQSWWNDGGVFKIHFGYGSSHDTDAFYIGICDKCMDVHIKDDRVVSLRNVKKQLREIDENNELF